MTSRSKQTTGHMTAQSHIQKTATTKAFSTRAIFRPIALPALILLLLLAPAMSGCGKLFDPGPAPARVHLFPTLPEPSSGPPIDKQLVIEAPGSGLDIDTDSIALLFNDREVKYLSGYRWTSRTPVVFQRAVVDALMANQSLRGVTAEGSVLSADARLITDIKRFHLRYTDKNQPPTAEIDAVMQLINQKDGSVVDSKYFQATTKATGNEVSQLMDAFEDTLAKILASSTPWIEQSMRSMR